MINALEDAQKKAEVITTYREEVAALSLLSIAESMAQIKEILRCCFIPINEEGEGGHIEVRVVE